MFDIKKTVPSDDEPQIVEQDNLSADAVRDEPSMGDIGEPPQQGQADAFFTDADPIQDERSVQPEPQSFIEPDSELPRQGGDVLEAERPAVHNEPGPGQQGPQETKHDIPQFGLPVDMRKTSPKIGQILVASGKITEENVADILAEQERRPSARFGEIGVEKRYISQKDVDEALASQFGFSSSAQSSAVLASEIVVAHNPFSPFAEALRGLRSQMMLRWFDGSPQQAALAMTSVDRSDGKSFITANLGVIFSQLGERTLIIDADLRNSTQHLKFGIQNRMGLSGVLSGRAGIEEILAVPGIDNLGILPSGAIPPNPQELLGREEFSRFLAAMAATFDVILIDTPSAQQASDAQVVAQRARAAVIVGRKDKTKSAEIAQLGAVMSSAGVKILGATLNEY
jgi:receptor protein-tyrosine kinase